MPREIITLQVGQCGNQSKSNPILNYAQSAMSSGSSSAWSTASQETAFLRSTQRRAMTGKMSSSTKLMMSTISQEHF